MSKVCVVVVVDAVDSTNERREDEREWLFFVLQSPVPLHRGAKCDLRWLEMKTRLNAFSMEGNFSSNVMELMRSLPYDRP